MTIKDIVRSVRLLLYSWIHSSTPDNKRFKKCINYLNPLITGLSYKTYISFQCGSNYISNYLTYFGWIRFSLWSLTPLLTIFQLWRSFSLVEETEYPEKTTDLSQVTDKFYHIMLYTSPWSRFESIIWVFQKCSNVQKVNQKIIILCLINYRICTSYVYISNIQTKLYIHTKDSTEWWI